MCLTGRLCFVDVHVNLKLLIQQVINGKRPTTADIVTCVVSQRMLHVLVLKVKKPSVIPGNIHILWRVFSLIHPTLPQSLWKFQFWFVLSVKNFDSRVPPWDP